MVGWSAEKLARSAEGGVAPVVFYVAPGEWEAFVRKCEGEGRSASVLVRLLIARFLEGGVRFSARDSARSVRVPVGVWKRFGVLAGGKSRSEVLGFLLREFVAGRVRV